MGIAAHALRTTILGTCGKPKGGAVNDYAKRLQQHLTTYKSQRLGVKEAGLFLYKGREVRCGHILPKDLKWLNLLESYRSEICQYLNDHRNIRPHKYFHHLNSSQAFALNLFFPYFEGGKSASAALLRALGVPGTVKAWLPEHIPDTKEGTNVDISWQNERGEWTYCEIKLSEQEFGKAKGESRHFKKLANIYGRTLQKYCPADLLEPETFFANYQILRNIWLAARNPSASVVFLLPTRNEVLWDPLHKVIDLLDTSLRKRIHLASMEKVLNSLSKDKACSSKLSWYAEQLSEKYTLP